MNHNSPPLANNDAVPKVSGDDVAYALVKAAISVVPLAGSPINEMLQLLGSPVEKRRDEWMGRISAAIRKLESNGLTIESLKSNEQFVSSVLQATFIAQRTHQQEKLEALRNALVNIATNSAPDEALQSIFLGYVEAFTEWHIRILRLFQAPTATGDMAELREVLEHRYPELRGRSDLYNAVWRDLVLRELVNMQFLHGSLRGTGGSLIDKRTTPLGDLFLKFIAEPCGYANQ
jgi:hypothetical protein